MKRIKATAEIQALKIIIRERTDEVVFLRNENEELRKQLEESRAKEGKGALEHMFDGIADAFANMQKIFSTINPDDLKARIIEDEYMFHEDDDFDFSEEDESWKN